MGRTYIFAGGGTGGHLYPGLAIWRRLSAIEPDARALFLCSDRPLDREILSKEGVEFRPLPAKPVALRPRGIVRFLRGWGPSLRQTRAAIRAAREKGGVTVVAMGGFVAAPAARAAKVERAPVVLVNLDAVPGKANRWIARRADRTFTALPIAPEAGVGSEWSLVVPIVRDAARPSGSPPHCRAALGIDPARPVLMVTGGSQGAKSLNDFVVSFMEQRTGRTREWQVLHQTGKGEAAAAAVRYQAAGIDAKAVEFSDRMGDWWGAADLAVCRAGAGNVAEAWAARVPTLFLPYPFHKDQHQKHNAAGLVQAGGAALATDRVDTAANLREVGPVLNGLMADAPRRVAMRDALHSLGPADGAETVARALSAGDSVSSDG